MYFARPIDFLALTNISKKKKKKKKKKIVQIYHVWVLFGRTPGVYSYLCHFGAINE